VSWRWRGQVFCVRERDSGNYLGLLCVWSFPCLDSLASQSANEIAIDNGLFVLHVVGLSSFLSAARFSSLVRGTWLLSNKPVSNAGDRPLEQRHNRKA
jgi:hypothetical protein